MKIKFASRSTLAFAALTFCLSGFIACDDSASSSPDRNAFLEGSSSSQEEQTSSSATSESTDVPTTSSVEAVNTSSSQEEHKPNSSSTTVTSAVVEPEVISTSSSAAVASATSSLSSSAQVTVQITLDKDGFATIADVYRSLAPSEKAVFVIRHSEREDAVTIETELTANGIKMAEDLGATLKSDEEFSYITSGFVRTNETANHIAAGRGTPNPKLITNYDITGNWFLKISADELATYADNLGMKGSSIELMSHWAYGEAYPDALYELEPRAKEFMETVILKNLPKWNRVSIMVSHDIFVMPLTVYGSQKQVALKYYEDYHWINYIAGLAIIVNEKKELRFIPVKGADSGVIDYLAIYMAEHNMKF